jgi:dienelactone hydrolase
MGLGRFVGLTAVLTALVCGIGPARAAISVEETKIKVEIRGWTYSLEAVVAKPAGVTGKLPIAMLTHGSPRVAADRQRVRALTSLLPQARDMAHRGWLAVGVIRRGFGSSDQPFAEGYDCDKPNFLRALSTAVEDVAAAHKVVATWPDADASRTVAIGVSVGGATMVAWSAIQPAGLRAVINVSGGTGSKAPLINCDENGLVSAFGTFGATSRVPTLWFYAENDSFLPPRLVNRMHAAFTNAGGNADLHAYGPMGEDGHNIWGMSDARVLWLTEVDKLLRAQKLPTWDPAPIDAATAQFNAAAKRTLAYYLAFPTEKALAISRQKGVARFIGNNVELPAARAKALDVCAAAANEPCDILIEDFAPLAAKAN